VTTSANGVSVEAAVKWYAVHVKSNQEKTCAAFLSDRNVEFFLPTYTVKSRRIDRRVTLAKPLFTGYLFVHIDPKSGERIQVLKAPGTVRIVGFGKGPTPVNEETIESIRILVGSGEKSVRPHPLVKVGNMVRVVDGPFKGALGVLFQAPSRKPRLVVEVEFLGRAVAVPISEDQVQPVFD
jgi:transcription antitermination factor NusG